MSTFFGSEILVNTTTSSDQLDPIITALSDGRFLMAWTDWSGTGGDTSNAAVRVQIFNTDGSKSGTEFLVNSTTSSNQLDPSIAAINDGRFVVAWTDWSATADDTSGRAVRAQVFNRDGSKSGTEFLVNTITSSDQSDPSITALSDGRFVVAWTDWSATADDTSGRAVRAQVFNTDGSKSGTEFLVNTATSNYQDRPSVTALSNGRFVVAWTDSSGMGGDTSNTAVRAQVFNTDGSKSGNEFLVNTTTTSLQDSPSITALSNGRFVVAWTDLSGTDGDTSGFAVRAQVFNTDGSKSGTEFLVNTTKTNNQNNPTITALSDGRFVVAWEDYSNTSGDISGSAVRAQVFNTDGSKSGTEFLVNTTTINGQSAPSITALSDGRFVVAWSDSSLTGGDTSGKAVRAQVFDPRLKAVSLQGSNQTDQWVGTAFNDKMLGGGGADSLDGSAGADTLIGGDGDDIYFVDNMRDKVTESNAVAAIGGTDLIYSSISLTLGKNIENLTLTGTAAINATGNTLANTLIGNAAANTLNGGKGADNMSGGDGSDLYIVDDIGDTVTETNSTVFTGGVDRVNSSVSFSLGANLENLTLTGKAAINATGNSLNNIIIGNAGKNILTGGAGRDTLTGGKGADVFDFNALSDTQSGDNRDVITDFKATQKDIIDLSGVDANSIANGDQAFSSTIITVGVFTQIGQLKFEGGILYGNTDEDFTTSEFEIELTGVTTLSVASLVL